MKLRTCCAFIGASLFLAPSLFAQLATTGVLGTGTVYITAPNYNGGNGYGGNGDQAGPYQITNLKVTSGDRPLSTTFQTFCLGTEVDYYPGTTYGYQISDTVEPSGPFGSSGVGSPGYVTWGVAYLYSQFLAGDLLNTIGGNSPDVSTGPTAEEDNDALQAAIWTLQGQTYNGIVQFGGTSNETLNASLVTQFLMDATNAAKADDISSVETNADGAFGVYALDMYNTNTDTYVQPQLVELPCVPEPSTVMAGVLMLLPLGISTVRAVRTMRKRREGLVAEDQS